MLIFVDSGVYWDYVCLSVMLDNVSRNLIVEVIIIIFLKIMK